MLVGRYREQYVYANYYEQNPAYEYLHDLQKDPNQLENLVNNPEYESILQEMRRLCKKEEQKVKK